MTWKAICCLLLLSAYGLAGPAAQGLPLATVLEPIEAVAIDSGLVAGKVLESGVRAWFGVPFAQAPVRELRWRSPQPIKWAGIYNADRFAPQCIQRLRGSNVNHYFGHESTSEDCLYLNIWAPPGSAAGDDRPVIVWIYGGAFSVGSASMRNYAGESLARKGAVYVGVSYRLGALGFLAHPELTAESPANASGNYGMLDQVAALQWVQRNVRQFGGDPQQVTIMGQSAGSMSISALQVSPLAADLFHGVIGMSGSLFGGVGSTDDTSLPKAEKSGLQFQEAIGADSIEALRHIPADRILAQQNECQRGCPERIGFGPIIDGYFLPERPAAIFAKGAQHDVPAMIGFTRDEGFNPIGRAQDLEQYHRLVGQVYGDKASELLRHYPAASDEEARRAARDVARDASMGLSMWNWATLQHSNGKQAVYPYMFSRVQPYTPGVTFADHDPATAGSYHTADVPYWLQTLDSLNLFRETRSYTDYDRQLADLMSNAILAFAESGDPSTDALNWPRFSSQLSQTVEFGGSTDALFKVMPWPNADTLAFFNENKPGPVNVTRTGDSARD